MNGVNQQTRLLIVDPETALREEFATILRTEGYEVSEATSGTNALKIFDETHPELVVLSLQLPDMDGLQVCQLIKWRSAPRKPSVIMMSRDPLSGFETLENFAYGPDDFLLKPVSIDVLLKRVGLVVRPQDRTSALREAREFNSRLLEDLTQAIVLLSVRGRLLGANPKALDLLGYDDQSELVERSALDLVPLDERQRFSGLLASTLTNEMSGDEQFNVIRKKGESLPVEISTSRITGSKGIESSLKCVLRHVSALQNNV